MRLSHALAAAVLASALVTALAGCSLVSQTPVRQVVTRVAESSPAVETSPTSPETEPATQPAETATPPVEPAKGGVKLDSDSGEKFGYLKKVWKADGVVYLTVDYAEMLTGDAAAKAAEAHSDESPPPNDYYIVNDNAKLRTFELRSDAASRFLVGGEPQLHDLAGAGAFLSKWDGAGSDAAIRVLPYELAIDGQAVTRLEQVYLP